MIPVRCLKTLPSLYLGKMCINLSRYSSFGGSTLPGRLAGGLSPQLLPLLVAQLREGCILITGTNGKTTTAHLLAHILTQAGKKVVHNHSGANLLSGVTTTFISASSWSGKIEADLGIIEVDEAAMPAVASRLRVKAALVTNLFPDQLDRFGEPRQTLKLIEKGLRNMDRDAFLLLNADDPLVSSIKGMEPSLLYYGIDDCKEVFQKGGQTAALKTCPHCERKLAYSHLHFAHLGIYSCPGCGLKRPPPHYSIASHLQKHTQGTKIALKTPTGILHVAIKIPGFYNLYNALAAISCALALGVEEELIQRSLPHFATTFGRMETLMIAGKMVELALIKNPAGANAVLQTLLAERHETMLLIAINDRYADGLDVSWLWDVDFEALIAPDNKITSIYCSGTRSKEIALRLKYAGIDPGTIKGEEELQKTFRESLNNSPAGGKLQILATYTALLELRKIINKMDHGKRSGRDKACVV